LTVDPLLSTKPVRFSVVIPTHDRLELLRDAIETVRRQDYADWELVVFDNASGEDIAGHVARLADPRVRYARSDAFLPVTDSWNRAMDLASGDYTVFLGDDDGLAPRYFSRMVPVTEGFGSPDIVYCAIYQFLHPGVAPWERQGCVADVKNAFFFAGQDVPFVLPAEQARKAIRGSLGLRRNFTFNIQAFAFSRAFLRRLRADGPIFRSPFPDYYLANVALAKSRSTVVVPAAMSIAGVSRASFGFTLFNDLEEQGAQILNAKLAADPLYSEVEHHLLPGPAYNSNYVVTMEHVAREVRGFVDGAVSYERYRRLQILALLAAGANEGGLWPRLGPVERRWAGAARLALRIGRALRVEGAILGLLRRVFNPYAFQPEQRVLDRGGFFRLIDVFEAIERGALR
jgi:glycosyltransferase involved in cell wall biosynthesis